MKKLIICLIVFCAVFVVYEVILDGNKVSAHFVVGADHCHCSVSCSGRCGIVVGSTTSGQQCDSSTPGYGASCSRSCGGCSGCKSCSSNAVCVDDSSNCTPGSCPSNLACGSTSSAYNTGVCSGGSCTKTSCTGTYCATGTCTNGSCTTPPPSCVGVTCTPGSCPSNLACGSTSTYNTGACSGGSCVTTSCTGTYCATGTCINGSCTCSCNSACTSWSWDCSATCKSNSKKTCNGTRTCTNCSKCSTTTSVEISCTYDACAGVPCNKGTCASASTVTCGSTISSVNDGTCTSGSCNTKTCGTGTKCPSGQSCNINGYYCEDDDSPTPPPTPVCTSDSDCKGCQSCVSGSCVDADSHCNEATCPTHTGYKGGTVQGGTCSSGTCSTKTCPAIQPPPVTCDPPCQSGQSCNNGVCEGPPVNKCANVTCTAGKCASSSSVACGSTISSVNDGTCTGGSCNTKTCGTGTKCSAGCTTCTGGSCVSSCSGSQVCHNGSCCTPKSQCNTCGGTESDGCGGRITCCPLVIPPSCNCGSWTNKSPATYQHICSGSSNIQKQQQQTRTCTGSCSSVPTTQWINSGSTISCGSGSTCSSDKCSLQGVSPTLTSTATSVTVSWTASTNTNVSGYDIRYCKSESACVTTTAVSVSGGSTATKTITGLDDDSTYRFKIRAVPTNSSTHNNSAYSSEISIKTLVQLNPLTAPSNVVLTSANSNEIKVAWSVSTNSSASGYAIQYCKVVSGSTCTPNIVVKVNGKSTNFHYISTDSGTKYMVRVKTTSSSGSNDSPYSTIYSKTTSGSQHLQCVAE